MFQVKLKTLPSISKVTEEPKETEMSNGSQIDTSGSCSRGYEWNCENNFNFNEVGHSLYSEKGFRRSERDHHSINNQAYGDVTCIRDRNENLVVKHPTVMCSNIHLHYNVIQSSQCQCEVLGSRLHSGVLSDHFENSTFTLDSDL